MDSGSFISLATSATALARIKGVELEQEKHLHVTNNPRMVIHTGSVPNKNSKNATCISKLPTPQKYSKKSCDHLVRKSTKKSLYLLKLSSLIKYFKFISCLFTYLHNVSCLFTYLLECQLFIFIVVIMSAVCLLICTMSAVYIHIYRNFSCLFMFSNIIFGAKFKSKLCSLHSQVL